MTTVYLANTFAVCAAFASFFQNCASVRGAVGTIDVGRKVSESPACARAVLSRRSRQELLIVFALVVEVRAGVVAAPWQTLSRSLIWLVVAYCGLGMIANAITPSKWERILWLPVVLVLLFTSLRVATS